MGFNDLTAKILDHSKTAFGETLEYIPRNGVRETFTGIFDEVYVEVDTGGEVATQSSMPVCGVKLIDLTNEPREGDELIARGQRYRVVDIEKDGRGHARLALHKVK